MKQYLFFFYITIKRMLMRPAFIIFLLLIPTGVFIGSNIPALTDENDLYAGVYLTDSDTTAKNIITRLINLESLVTFIEYDNPDSMQKDIISGDIECGYIISENLTKKLDTGEFKNSVSLISGSNSSLITSLTNELFFSTLLKIYGKNMVANYISENDYFQGYDEILNTLINEQYHSYLNSDSVFYVEFDTIKEGGTLDDLTRIEEVSSVFPLRGVLSILIFAAGMFGSLQYLKDTQEGVFITTKKGIIALGAFLYPFVLSLLTGISGCIALNITGSTYGIFAELSTLFIYCIILSIECMILSFIMSNPLVFAGAIPVILIICLVACPVFVNIAPLVPGVKIVRMILAPMYYLT